MPDNVHDKDAQEGGVITVTYRNGDDVRVLETDREPAEVLEFCRARIFPGVQVPAFDAQYERIMEARKA